MGNRLDTGAHTYNPSYSGRRDQKDPVSKSALGKCFTRFHLKNAQQKKRLWSGSSGKEPT
jgi:hypothetical protein